MKRVAVIGAGWSGLAAAVRLSSAGLPVTVFEASRQLGGRARRVSIEGQHLDNGQHILIGAYRSTLDLLRELGSDPDRVLLRQPLDLRYADGFRMHASRLPAPLHLAWALAGARGLSWTERLGAARRGAGRGPDPGAGASRCPNHGPGTGCLAAAGRAHPRGAGITWLRAGRD